MQAGSRITAAATTGPAQGPRPASSMPQTGAAAACSKAKSGGIGDGFSGLAGRRDHAAAGGRCPPSAAKRVLKPPRRGDISPPERLARAGASPTRSGPEGSSRNGTRLGRCPASHLQSGQGTAPRQGHRSLPLGPGVASLPSPFPRRGRGEDVAMDQQTADQQTDRSGGPPETDAAYRVLARKYRPATFADLVGQEAMVRTLRNAFAAGPHRPCLHADRACAGSARPPPRGSSPRALNCIGPGRHGRPDHRALRRLRALRRDRRGPPRRRAGDGRRLAHRRRRHPRDHRSVALPGGRGALQGLHHRRGAHAVSTSAFNALLKTLEEPPRACEVHLRHHRDPQGPGDGAVALPALRPAPDRARGDARAISRRIAAAEGAAIARRTRWR